MSEINIVTAQNVTLKIELANIGDRFLAAFLDLLIKLGVMLGVGIFFGLVADTDTEEWIAIYWIVILVFWAFYSLVFEFFMHGQTPGKRAMKIRVVKVDGEQVTLGSLLLRWLFRIIDFPLAWPTIGITMVVFTEKFQRIGDLVAGTILVSTKERTDFEDTSFTEVGANYEPMYPQATELEGKDVEIIKKVIRLYYEHDKYDLLEVTAARVKEVLDIQPRVDDLSFLKTILKDYNYAENRTGGSDDSRF